MVSECRAHVWWQIFQSPSLTTHTETLKFAGNFWLEMHSIAKHSKLVISRHSGTWAVGQLPTGTYLSCSIGTQGRCWAFLRVQWAWRKDLYHGTVTRAYLPRCLLQRKASEVQKRPCSVATQVTLPAPARFTNCLLANMSREVRCISKSLFIRGKKSTSSGLSLFANIKILQSSLIYEEHIRNPENYVFKWIIMRIKIKWDYMERDTFQLMEEKMNLLNLGWTTQAFHEKYN